MLMMFYSLKNWWDLIYDCYSLWSSPGDLNFPSSHCFGQPKSFYSWQKRFLLLRYFLSWMSTYAILNWLSKFKEGSIIGSSKSRHINSYLRILFNGYLKSLPPYWQRCKWVDWLQPLILQKVEMIWIVSL